MDKGCWNLIPIPGAEGWLIKVRRYRVMRKGSAFGGSYTKLNCYLKSVTVLIISSSVSLLRINFTTLSQINTSAGRGREL